MMKKIIILVILFINQLLLFAQTSERDSILKKVEEYKSIVFKDASIFINNALPAEERINAIQKHAIIYDESQKKRITGILISDNEKPEIRAAALNKLYSEVDKDNKLFAQIISWFSDPKTPKVLREESLNVISNLSFTSAPQLFEVYAKMVEDPDLIFREFAFSRLIFNGDPRAQALLIRGLEDKNARLLEPIPSIQILSSAPKKDFYPAVYKLMLETKNEDERLIAIQAIGGYQQARNDLMKIFLASNEKSNFRESALVSFYSNNKNETVDQLIKLLQDNTASVDLKIIAIQIAINQRMSMSYRKKAKRADALDNLVRNISLDQSGGNDENLVSIAKKYLLIVRPNFNE